MSTDTDLRERLHDLADDAPNAEYLVQAALNKVVPHWRRMHG